MGLSKMIPHTPLSLHSAPFYLFPLEGFILLTEITNTPKAEAEESL